MSWIKQTASAGLVAATLLTAFPALAQTPPTNVNRPANLNRATTTRGLSDTAKSRFTNAWSNTLRRINASIERHQKVVDRFNTFITNHPDLDTTAAKSLISQATSELAAAKTALADAQAAYDALIGSERPRDAFQAFKEKVRAVTSHIKTAHRLLQQARSLLAQVRGEAMSATTTPTGTPAQ